MVDLFFSSFLSEINVSRNEGCIKEANTLIPRQSLLPPHQIWEIITKVTLCFSNTREHIDQILIGSDIWDWLTTKAPWKGDNCYCYTFWSTTRNGDGYRVNSTILFIRRSHHDRSIDCSRNAFARKVKRRTVMFFFGLSPNCWWKHVAPRDFQKRTFPSASTHHSIDFIDRRIMMARKILFSRPKRIIQFVNQGTHITYSNV